jgi:hypothetical protein
MPRNFQNWQALGMDTDPGNPSSSSNIPGTEFEDWSNLRGPSDLIKQAVRQQAGIPSRGGQSGDAPVAPPQNWGEAMDAAVKPFQQKFENVQNAVGQLGQGNTYGAVASMQGQKPMVGPQPEQAQSSEQGGLFNFSRF